MKRKKNMSVCGICQESCNKRNRKAVSCPKCNELACRACISIFVLNSSTLKCMYCSTELDEGFLEENMPKTFVKEFQTSKVAVQLLNNEMSLMPLTQAKIVQEKREELLEQLPEQRDFDINYTDIRKRVIACMICKRNFEGLKFAKCLACYLPFCFGCIRLAKTMEGFNVMSSDAFSKCWGCASVSNKVVICKDYADYELSEIEKLMFKKGIFANMFEIMISDIKHLVQRMKMTKKLMFDIQDTAICFQDDTKGVSHMRCPMGCNGFLINGSPMTCPQCAHKVCEECHKNFEQDHKCDPQDIDTVETLRHETKPCPQCFSPIFKESGCDQMFCVVCHLVFSWKTGKTEKGTIHNPHHAEYMKKIRNLSDEEIAQILTVEDFLKFRVAEAYQHVSKDLVNLTHSFLQMYGFLENFRMMNRWDNEDLRRRYLDGLLTELNFKRTLLLRKKKKDMQIAIANELEIFAHEYINKICFMWNPLMTKWRPTKEPWDFNCLLNDGREFVITLRNKKMFNAVAFNAAKASKFINMLK